jgi:ferredoxin
MPAYRYVRNCDKECLCLYVCPTGATDTENSIIDVSKCLPGCRICVDACPAGAISLLPDSYPPQQSKTTETIVALRRLAASKLRQESIARQLSENADNSETARFANAVARSNRLMAEDILREAGFMLPQSAEVHRLLKSLLLQSGTGSESDSEPVRQDIELLLERLNQAE